MNTPVSLELAKLLKEKGFDNRTLNWYHRKTKKLNTNDLMFSMNKLTDNYSAPTIAQVVMWLYEKYGIWLYVGMKIKEDGTDESWFIPNGRYIPTKKKNGVEIDPIVYMCAKSPTEAYSAGIEYILKELL